MSPLPCRATGCAPGAGGCRLEVDVAVDRAAWAPGAGGCRLEINVAVDRAAGGHDDVPLRLSRVERAGVIASLRAILAPNEILRTR